MKSQTHTHKHTLHTRSTFTLEHQFIQQTDKHVRIANEHLRRNFLFEQFTNALLKRERQGERKEVQTSISSGDQENLAIAFGGDSSAEIAKKKKRTRICVEVV